MNVADIRRTFLKFFEERGHTAVPSSAVVPENDPTLYFVNAGMVPFKDVFTGQEQRPYTRAVSVQKCMRVSGKHNDLDNVGFTARHHTLFEMLGNFSFGDYFKEEAIEYAWTFLREVMGLPADRLLVTVYKDDDESAAIWERIGVAPERIGRCGDKDNFWSMGPTGPCGPCSEIFWDLQSDFVLDDEPDPWGYGHDAGRYMEIWNNVFMQYERYIEDGVVKQRDLPRPSVDTGMGLERLAAVSQGHKSNWEIDELQRIIGHAGSIAGKAYGDDEDANVCMRVIADHSRAAAFLVSDGIMPANEGRGYELRRIMRRAIRYGVKLGIDRPFMHETVATVIELMHETYPDLRSRQDFILKVIANEEDTFRATLDRGLELLDGECSKLDPGAPLPGDVAFKLHDTFGFPPDLTEIIVQERGHGLDRAGYDAAMKQQKERSRASWKGSGQEQLGDVYRRLEHEGSTEFTGYEATEGEGEVIALLVDGHRVAEATVGQSVELVVDATPFYAESGGQVGDSGLLQGPDGTLRVDDCQKPGGTVFIHRGEVREGTIRTGERVQLRVDANRRGDIVRNHTGTHLLHAALRSILGTHVQQKGSLVDGERLRFDFSHFEPIDAETLAALERSVNDQIRANTTAVTDVTSMDDAVERGAMALFGEKYGDVVRLVEIAGYSTELCGGTHVSAVGQIGLLKITSEAGIAAGVRRIEAVTGRRAFEAMQEMARREVGLGALVRARGDEAIEKVSRLLDDRKALQRQVEELKQKLVVAGSGGGGGPQARDVAGVQVLATLLEGVAGKELRGHGDALMDTLGSGVIVLGVADGAKASLLVKVSKDLSDRVSAGSLIKELAPMVGGRGGGRSELAQAGGKDPSGLPAALERAYELVGAALA
jgi:alanyl-tRNA synthetase